jgi:hypothetical protein
MIRIVIARGEFFFVNKMSINIYGDTIKIHETAEPLPLLINRVMSKHWIVAQFLSSNANLLINCRKSVTKLLSH